MPFLRQSIAKTVTYARRHGASLTKEQLCLRLLSNRLYPDEKIIKTAKLMGIPLKNGESNKIVTAKLRKAEWLAQQLTRFNTIEMIGVTGSVAAENCDIDDDIDLLIITKAQSLWLTRFQVMFWLWIHKIPHRRYFRPEARDMFCFNLWLESDSLGIINHRQNRSSAVDLVMMKPVYDQNNCYQRFLNANSWAKKFVATGYQKLILNNKFLMTNKRPTTSLFWKIVNWKCYVLQRIYMNGKIGKGDVGLKWAYFYP